MTVDTISSSTKKKKKNIESVTEMIFRKYDWKFDLQSDILVKYDLSPIDY